MIQERPHNGNQLHQPKMRAFYMSTINIVCYTLHVLFFSLTEQVTQTAKCMTLHGAYGVCLSYHACCDTSLRCLRSRPLGSEILP